MYDEGKAPTLVFVFLLGLFSPLQPPSVQWERCCATQHMLPSSVRGVLYTAATRISTCWPVLSKPAYVKMGPCSNSTKAVWLILAIEMSYQACGCSIETCMYLLTAVLGLSFSNTACLPQSHSLL